MDFDQFTQQAGNVSRIKSYLGDAIGETQQAAKIAAIAYTAIKTNDSSLWYDLIAEVGDGVFESALDSSGLAVLPAKGIKFGSDFGSAIGNSIASQIQDINAKVSLRDCVCEFLINPKSGAFTAKTAAGVERQCWAPNANDPDKVLTEIKFSDFKNKNSSGMIRDIIRLFEEPDKVWVGREIL